MIVPGRITVLSPAAPIPRRSDPRDLGIARLTTAHYYSYNGYMKKARIAVAKNNLSRLIDDVKRGETVLILDRDTPVARLEPIGRDLDLSAARMSGLVSRGAVAPPRKPLDATAFLDRSMPVLPPGTSGVQTLLAEREAGR